MRDPRLNSECAECVTGEYEYRGQVLTPSGDYKSQYECGQCGDEVRVS